MIGTSGVSKQKSKPRSSSLFENPTLLVKGQDAESIVQDFLHSWKSHITQVEDLREDTTWQERDVDFRVHMRTGTKLLIEVKSDKWLGVSRNVLFEVLRIHHTATPEHCARLGWSIFSGADRFFVWSPEIKSLYVFKTEDFRRAMQNYVKASRREANVSIVPTDSKRTTFNILVPITYVPYLVYAKREGKWELIGKYEATQPTRKAA